MKNVFHITGKVFVKLAGAFYFLILVMALIGDEPLHADLEGVILTIVTLFCAVSAVLIYLFPSSHWWFSIHSQWDCVCRFLSINPRT